MKIDETGRNGPTAEEMARGRKMLGMITAMTMFIGGCVLIYAGSTQMGYIVSILGLIFFMVTQFTASNIKPRGK